MTRECLAPNAFEEISTLLLSLFKRNDKIFRSVGQS